MARIREGYLREGEDHYDDSAVQSIVERCAQCSRRYPVTDCLRCVYNVANYGVDPGRAGLLRAHARIRQQEEAQSVRRYNKYVRRENRKTTLGEVGYIIAFILAVVACGPFVRECKSAPQLAAGTFQEVYARYAPKSAVPQTSQNSGYSTSRVQRALNSTAGAIKDVTRDRKINCQDYSILFTRYYGEGAQLYYHPPAPHWPKGHLYVRAQSADGWVYIRVV
jgi:hypothetical protein